MPRQAARDQLEDVELGSAILGVICLAIYGTGFIQADYVLVAALGLMILSVGADELLSRLPGEP